MNNLLTHRVELDGLTPPDIIWRPYDGFVCPDESACERARQYSRMRRFFVGYPTYLGERCTMQLSGAFSAPASPPPTLFGEVKSLGAFLTAYDLRAEGDSATNFPWSVDEYFAWNKRGVRRYVVGVRQYEGWQSLVFSIKKKTAEFPSFPNRVVIQQAQFQSPSLTFKACPYSIFYRNLFIRLYIHHF